jgi:cytochrome b561
MLYILVYMIGITTGLAIGSLMVSRKLLEAMEPTKNEKPKESRQPDRGKAIAIKYMTPSEEQEEREVNRIKALYI